jgi:hypothetical protein
VIKSKETSEKDSFFCSPASHETVSESPNRRKNVIPAKAGIQLFLYSDYHTDFSIPD